MPGFTPAQILNTWEQAAGRHAVDRALTMLWTVDPVQDYADLAHLPLGERNARLLQLHAGTFGNRMLCCADCPVCSERLEFSVYAQDVLAAATSATSSSSEHTLELDGKVQKFRLINSLDLAAAAQKGSFGNARQELVRRCITGDQPSGQLPAAAEQMSDSFIAQLAAALAAADPLADIVFNLTCPVCGGAWQAPFDIASYLWEEVRSLARRLLVEIHTLASAYGWREADILALSPARRQAYLELTGTGTQKPGELSYG